MGSNFDGINDMNPVNIESLVNDGWEWDYYHEEFRKYIYNVSRLDGGLRDIDVINRVRWANGMRSIPDIIYAAVKAQPAYYGRMWERVTDEQGAFYERPIATPWMLEFRWSYIGGLEGHDLDEQHIVKDMGELKLHVANIVDTVIAEFHIPKKYINETLL